MAEGLINTSARGKHATGIAIAGEAGVRVYKKGVSAREWEASGGYADAAANLCADDWAIIGHARYATHGSPAINANNHPLAGRRVTLAHNGVCRNQLSLKARYGDYAEVDSAGILAALDHYAGAERKGRLARVSEAWSEVDGDNAGVFAVDGDDRLFAVADGKPLTLSRVSGGAVWIASTKECLPESVRRGAAELPDGHAYAFSQRGLFRENEYAMRALPGKPSPLEREGAAALCDE